MPRPDRTQPYYYGVICPGSATNLSKQEARVLFRVPCLLPPSNHFLTTGKLRGAPCAACTVYATKCFFPFKACTTTHLKSSGFGPLQMMSIFAFGGAHLTPKYPINKYRLPPSQYLLIGRIRVYDYGEGIVFDTCGQPLYKSS